MDYPYTESLDVAASKDFSYEWREASEGLLFPTGLHRSFWKNILHPSGCVVNFYYITCCGLKDVSGIFQFPFMAESDKKFSAERFFNLSRMIFRSAPNDFSSCIKRNETWLKDT